MKTRHAIMGLTLGGALLLVLLEDRQASGEVSEPVTRAGAPALPPQRGLHAGAVPVPAAILRLEPREALMAEGAQASSEGSNDAFASRDWTPPPPPPPAAAPPPPPSQAPPFPFTYLGKTLEEGKWEVHLARDEHTYSVRNQDVIDGTYRIDSIRPPLMTMTYLPLNQVQQLNIGVFE